MRTLGGSRPSRRSSLRRWKSRCVARCRAASSTPRWVLRCGCSVTTATSTRSTARGPSALGIGAARCRLGNRRSGSVAARRFASRPVSSGFRRDGQGALRGPCRRRIAAPTGVGVLVSLGGDSQCRRARTRRWPVLIADDHVAGLESAGPQIRIRSGGLATSGTTVRRWRRGEQELHHLRRSRTGRPAAEHWRTASVAAASCVDANIASTAAIIMARRTPGWLEARSLPARLVTPRRSRAACRGMAGRRACSREPRRTRRRCGTRRARPAW